MFRPSSKERYWDTKFLGKNSFLEPLIFNKNMKNNLNFKVDRSLFFMVLVVILAIGPGETFAQLNCMTEASGLPSHALPPPPNAVPNDGPFYFRLYYHIVRRSNGTGGQPSSRIIEIHDRLNSVFAPIIFSLPEIVKRTI
jgi:hypothetical protein